ncbi:DNA polymerase sliding clamp [Methanosarcinales archaeon]|nr:MAG: DNA polymerase sliding clamp [Methanosarcinales archaeon]
MFKATIDAELFKDAVDVVSVLVDESIFSTDEEVIISKAVEPANAAMVILEMKKDAFDIYESDSHDLGIDLKRLSTVLDMAQRGDMVELELEDHKLKIVMGGLRYHLSLLDPSTIRKIPKVPQIQLPAKVVVDGSTIQRAIKAASTVGSYVALGVEDESFYIETEGDTDKLRFVLGKDELIDLQGDDVRSLFSLDYLRSITKSRAFGRGIVTLEIGIDYPIKISFSFADDKIKALYIVAPRVEAV